MEVMAEDQTGSDRHSGGTYKKLAGTSTYGLDYENRVTAYIVLKLISKKDVRNFTITSNEIDYGFFDDLILKVEYTSGRTHCFCFQIKYRERKHVPSNFLSQDRRDFSLSKMFKSFQELKKKENKTLILFTNVKFEGSEDNLPLTFRSHLTTLDTQLQMFKAQDVIEIFPNGNIFQFEASQDKEESVKHFLEKLYFYTDQYNIKELQRHIPELLDDILQHHLSDSFLHLVKEWRASRFILTKEDVLLKLAELTFSPFISTISDTLYNKTCKSLHEIVMNFNLTLVETSDEIVQKIWQLPERTKEESKICQKYLLKENDRVKALWYMNQLPLVLKVDDWNETIIKKAVKLLEENVSRKLILVGSISVESFRKLNIFRDLSDVLKTKINLESLSDFQISLQERDPISLKDLFQLDPEIAAAFSAKDLFHMTQGALKIGKKVAKVPKSYIKRRIKRMGQEVEEDNILTSFDSNGINLVSTEAGCGGTTLLASLANHCPASYWSIFVKLREHASFFKRKPTIDEALRHFLEIDKHDSIADRIKERYFKNGMIYIFLDGLDEIDFVDDILNFATHISKSGVKVWLSARSFLAHSINRLNIEPIYIEKFDEEFLKKKGIPEFKNISVLEISLLEKILKRGGSSQRCKIYQTFFSLIKKPHQTLESYEILALKTCFNEKTLHRLNPNHAVENFIRGIEREGDELGLITKIDEFGAIFENKSIAEYLSAVWLSKNLEKVKLISDELFLPKNGNLKFMFDLILAEECPVHVDLLYGNCCQVVGNEPKDKGGRSVFHLMSSLRHIDQELLKSIPLEKEIFENDQLFHWNCIDYAIKAENFLVIDRFLEKLEDSPHFNELYQHHEVAFLATQLGYTNLLTACLKRDPEVVKSKTGPEESSLLHVALTSKNNVEEIIDILTAHKIDVNVKDRKKRTALQLVLEGGDCKLAKILIEKGADVNLRVNGRRTLLHHLVSFRESNYEVIQLLIEKGISVNSIDIDGATPLHVACQQGNIDSVQVLLENGANLTALTLYKKTVLHYAVSAKNPDLEIIKLLNKGIEVNCQDANNVTALHLAAEKESFEIVEILLQCGANICCIDKSGKNALHYCLLGSESLDILNLLIKNEIFDTSDNSGITLLHLAAYKGALEIAQRLLDCGGNINCQDKNGRTVLHYIASSDKATPELIDLFCDKGLESINAADSNGLTPLHVASEKGREDIVETLLDLENIDIKAVTKMGRTALHYAQKPEVARLLIEANIDVNFQDLDGVSSLHLACQKADLTLVELLVDAGADINAVTSKGRNCLHYAASTCAKNTEVLELLMGKGVSLRSDIDGLNPLHLACRYNNNYNAEVLLKYEIDINAVSNDGDSVLHFAAFNALPNVELLELLKRNGVDMEWKNKKSATPREVALKEGNKDFVESLFDMPAEKK